MSKIMPGSVTLTQDQLNSILASVGSIVSGKDNGIQISIDPLTSKVNIVKGNEASSVKPTTKKSQNTNLRSQQTNNNRQALTKGGNSNRSIRSTGKISQRTSTKNVANKEELKKKGTLIESHDNELKDESVDKGENNNHVTSNRETSTTDEQLHESVVASIQESTAPPAPAPQTSITSPPVVVRGHLTMAERKRLQWQREREEMQKIQSGGYYDPWGRPGCGAPTSKPDISPITQPLDTRSVNKEHVSVIPEPTLQNATMSTSVPVDQSHPSYTTMPTNQQPVSSIPAAMRSSFVFGEEAVDSQKNNILHNSDKQKWLDELEKQRNEQRLKKAQVKEKERENIVYETWAEKSITQPPIIKQISHPVTMDSHTHVGVGEDGGGSQSRVSSAPETSRVKTVDDVPKELKATNYMHGQNVYIDPITKRELEEKRQRQLEHQAEIMAQVEEKKRLKEREKQQKMEEEREYEMKWRGEVDNQQLTTRTRHQSVKEQQVSQETKMEQMTLALEQARLDSQRDRQLKRIQRLQQGGHDVHNLQAKLEDSDSEIFTPRTAAGITPRLPNPPPTSHDPDKCTNETQAESKPQTKQTTQIQQTENLETREFVTSPLRECGTQTEAVVIRKPSKRLTEKEISDVHIQYDPKNHRDTKNVAPNNNIESETNSKQVRLKISERPRWGYSNTKKLTSLKQSERELIDSEKKKRTELRRAKREQKLLNLVELNKNRVSEMSSRGQAHNNNGGPMKNSRGVISDSAINNANIHHHANALQSTSEGVFSSGRNINGQLGHDASNMGHHTDSGHSQKQGTKLDRSIAHDDHKTLNLGRVRPNSGHDDDKMGHGYPKVGHTAPLSPVIPAIRHRIANKNLDKNRQDNSRQSPYGDQEYFQGGISEFVPFLRSTATFDPTSANDRALVSREATAARIARRAYIEGQKPGVLGSEMEDIDDVKNNVGYPNLHKDPIINPDMVTNHPTPRQDLILHQLQQLKQTLLQRRLEAESYLPYTDLASTASDPV